MAVLMVAIGIPQKKYGNFDEDDMKSPNGPAQEWFFLVADVLDSYDFKKRNWKSRL